jgi:hypothetical protein
MNDNTENLLKELCEIGTRPGMTSRESSAIQGAAKTIFELQRELAAMRVKRSDVDALARLIIQTNGTDQGKPLLACTCYDETAQRLCCNRTNCTRIEACRANGLRT